MDRIPPHQAPPRPTRPQLPRDAQGNVILNNQTAETLRPDPTHQGVWYQDGSYLPVPGVPPRPQRAGRPDRSDPAFYTNIVTIRPPGAAPSPPASVADMANTRTQLEAVYRESSNPNLTPEQRLDLLLGAHSQMSIYAREGGNTSQLSDGLRNPQELQAQIRALGNQVLDQHRTVLQSTPQTPEERERFVQSYNAVERLVQRLHNENIQDPVTSLGRLGLTQQDMQRLRDEIYPSVYKVGQAGMGSDLAVVANAVPAPLALPS